MDHFPRLYTERLILRKIEVEDVPALIKYANNQKIAQYILNIPHPYQEPDAVFRISYVYQGFKAKTRYVFAIILKETSELIGEISLHLDNGKTAAQLAYWLGEPCWGSGYTTEAIQAIVAFGFEQLPLHIIYATCEEENIASQRVLEKNQFKKNSSVGRVLQYSVQRDASKQ